MGPSRNTAERESAWRMRYALYCLRWFAGLALALGLLLAFKPSVHASPLPFLLMFLYVGLPLGTATSGLAALGFLVGAFWSRRLERSGDLARKWPKAKAWLRALALLPVSGFGAFEMARGLIHGELWIPWQHRQLGTVRLSEEPLGFCVVMVAWGAMTLGLLYYQFIELRRARA